MLEQAARLITGCGLRLFLLPLTLTPSYPFPAVARPCASVLAPVHVDPECPAMLCDWITWVTDEIAPRRTMSNGINASFMALAGYSAAAHRHRHRHRHSHIRGILLTDFRADWSFISDRPVYCALLSLVECGKVAVLLVEARLYSVMMWYLAVFEPCIMGSPCSVPAVDRDPRQTPLAGFKVKWIQQSFSRLMAREAREHEYRDGLSPWPSGPALGGVLLH
ncbi:hypothetical protein AAWM_07286 [Aspergillus awamori]|uniref:Secreted protein n=1 Tax=Aspergillus awamori TaxID=105351 RepID=A0A401KYT8_ASPAW|nr:hypothetical protein AAWM_07286 [Aspergillus awamori]